MKRRPHRPHIVFAGGGTGGHLFPGLAVAERLLLHAPDLRITFVGAGRTFESARVSEAGYEYLALPCRPLPRSAREAFGFLTDNLAGYYSARFFLREQRATLVVGLGGYASAPATRAAASLRIPLVLLEQNAVPGRATRWLARRAKLVCAAFAEVRPRLHSGVRVEITGNPLRAGFHLPQETALSFANRGEPRLLVLGGSGGAGSLNQHVPMAIYKAGASLAGWNTLHQCGQRDVEATARLYGKLGLTARVTSFIDDMPATLATTELAISRAGGTTLAELAACRVPAILIPYPRAADDHQLRNAEVFHAAGACRLIDERQLEGRFDDHLAMHLRALANDRALRRRLGAAAHRLSKPHATERVATAMLELLRVEEQVEAPRRAA